MARYRKIDLRMHGDEKYRRLTPAPPCGQALWWHLLAGAHTDIIPGVSVIGEAAFAEQLGWPLKGFRKAFQEVLREGMAEADWGSRVLWVPNAIKYNSPASPNVVRSWRTAWDEIPECPLKSAIYTRLQEYMAQLAEGFSKAFAETCEDPSGKPSREARQKPLPNQEQEHQQEQSPPSPPPEGAEPDGQRARTRATKVGATCPEPAPGFDEFWEAYPKKEKKTEARRSWDRLKPNESLLAQILGDVRRRAGTEEWRKDRGRYIPQPTTYLNQKRWEDEGVKLDPGPARTEPSDANDMLRREVGRRIKAERSPEAES